MDGGDCLLALAKIIVQAVAHRSLHEPLDHPETTRQQEEKRNKAEQECARLKSGYHLCSRLKSLATHRGVYRLILNQPPVYVREDIQRIALTGQMTTSERIESRGCGDPSRKKRPARRR